MIIEKIKNKFHFFMKNNKNLCKQKINQDSFIKKIYKYN